jgi:hypothetical protein
MSFIQIKINKVLYLFFNFSNIKYTNILITSLESLNIWKLGKFSRKNIWYEWIMILRELSYRICF